MGDLQEYLDFAIQLARHAQPEIMARYRLAPVEHKDDGSVVTDGDREAERTIRRLIAERYPTHGILGEEFSDTGESSSRYRWVIDPIDGTMWYALGVPTFGTLVALLENDEPVVGVAHLPAVGETYSAATGLGCWFQAAAGPRVRIRVDESAPRRLGTSFVSASGVHHTDLRNDGEPTYRLSAVIRAAERFRFCGDFLQHMLVAHGRLHAAIDTQMRAWDSAALVPCVEEAGGVACTLAGERAGVVFGGSLLTASNPQVRDDILETLHREPTPG